MLIFTKFKQEDKHLLEEWMIHDSEGMKFLGSYAKYDFAHLIDFVKRHLWIVSNEENQIGFFDFEIKDSKIGYPAFYIRPEYRGMKTGYQLLSEAMELPELKGVALLEAGVEKNNSASIKTLEKAGFRHAYTDVDGMFVYQLKVRGV